MAYKTDGSSHANGIKNEKQVVKFLNEIQNVTLEKFIFSINGPITEYKTAGGTQRKEDAFAYRDNDSKFGITIKNHKSGTVDYLNTSKIGDYLGKEIATNIKADLETVKKKYCEDFQNSQGQEKEEIKKQARLEIKEISRNAILKINDNVIKQFLTKIKSSDPALLIVNDQKNSKLLFIKKENRDDLNNFMTFSDKNQYELITKRNAIESATIFKDGIDTKIRIRVALNNGVGALLGGDSPTSKNKNSTMTIKAQNDNVAGWFQNKKAILI